MTHPTDSLLNEYLDEALDPSARRNVESHLDNCAACQEKVTSLQSISRILASLPDALLPHDLTPSVWNKLAHRPLGLVWKLALAVQAGFVTGLLILIAPLATSKLVETAPGLANQAIATILKLPRSITFTPEIPAFRFPQLPVYRFPVPVTSSNSSLWLVLGIAASLLFIVGNFSLIFRNRPGAKK